LVRGDAGSRDRGRGRKYFWFKLNELIPYFTLDAIRYLGKYLGLLKTDISEQSLSFSFVQRRDYINN
jgi:hypothetical protein